MMSVLDKQSQEGAWVWLAQSNQIGELWVLGTILSQKI